MRSTRHDFRIIFFSFFFEKLIYFSWMLVTLKYCVGFCQTHLQREW